MLDTMCIPVTLYYRKLRYRRRSTGTSPSMAHHLSCISDGNAVFILWFNSRRLQNTPPRAEASGCHHFQLRWRIPQSTTDVVALAVDRGMIHRSGGVSFNLHELEPLLTEKLKTNWCHNLMHNSHFPITLNKIYRQSILLYGILSFSDSWHLPFVLFFYFFIFFLRGY